MATESARAGWKGAVGIGTVVVGLALVITVLWTTVASAAPASVVSKGSSERKQIALTFDDNYSVDRSLATLRALEKNGIPATLFVIGAGVKASPAINREIVKGMAEGRLEVGDHSRSHPVLTKLSAAGMAAEIGGGTDAFRAATGARTVPLFRPPYGSTNSQVAAVAGSRGFRYLVLWDVDPRDWAGGSASSIADHVVAHARNGSIVVMHLSAAHTAAAIPSITSRLRDRGFEFVTVSKMLKGDRLFFDVDYGTEASRAIARMVDLNHMSGYNADYFGPGDTITRAQVAKVTTLVGGLHTPEVEKMDSPTFPDVPLYRGPDGSPLPYPFDFVEDAAAAGLVQGSQAPDGRFLFRPNEPITRVQLAQVLARMVRQLKGYGTVLPGDSPGPVAVDVPSYAAADVALVAKLGLMSGYAGGRFDPWAGAIRAHVAVVMSRYLDLSPAQPAD